MKIALEANAQDRARFDVGSLLVVTEASPELHFLAGPDKGRQVPVGMIADVAEVHSSDPAQEDGRLLLKWRSATRALAGNTLEAAQWFELAAVRKHFMLLPGKTSQEIAQNLLPVRN